MADTLKVEIIKILNETRDQIRANMAAKKVNASGRTSDSIRVEPYPGGVRLIGGTDGVHKIEDYPPILGTLDASDTAPIPTLEVGRVGGKVPRGFYYIIREWSREKGLNFSSESERGTFAYFVAQKIARQGTKRSTTHVDIYGTPVEETKEKINQLLRDSVSHTLRAALGNASVTGLPGAFAG